MYRKLFLSLVVTALLVSVLPALAQQSAMDIVDTAAADGRFTTLVAAVEAAGLVDTLRGEGPFTIFAPTDDAFAALPEGTVEGLLADIPALTDVLLYHVVPGAVRAADIVNLETATTAQGSDINISVRDGAVVLNDSVQVTITNIEASNGVIHVIDGVLLPPSAEGEMAEQEMVELRVAHLSPDTPAVDVFVNGEAAISDLAYPAITNWLQLPAGSYNIAVAPAGAGIETAAIGPADFTLSASDFVTLAAIGSLEAGTLAPQVLVEDYSALNDGIARISVFHAIEDAPAVDILANGAPLITELAYPASSGDNDGFFVLEVPAGTYDVQVVPAGETEPVVLDLPGATLEANTNTFVAAIGTLAEPKVAVAATSLETDEEEPMVSGNLVETAIADGRFGTLVNAVTAAGLVETLSGEGPFTVFAPTDDAFAALPAGTVEELLANTQALTDVLLYHVLSGEVPASDVAGMRSATTLQGSDSGITVNDQGVFLNDTVQVIVTDVPASNGVIHVIDAVLLPPAE